MPAVRTYGTQFTEIDGVVGCGTPDDVTTNLPVADPPSAAFASTSVPDVPFGTVNVQVNDPALLVFSDPPPGHKEMGTPSKTSAVSAEEG
jgi:hypothetical protein